MKTSFRNILAVACLALAGQAIAEVTFYEREGFAGQSFSTDSQVGNLERFGFNDRASSAIVTSERWEVCDERRFRGRCVILRPGEYPSLASMGLNNRITSVQPIRRDARIDENQYAPLPMAPPRDNAQIMFFENEGFGGRSFGTDERVGNFARIGFNDRASSVVVFRNRWEVCEDAGFRGRCVVLRPGRYPSLAAMGLNDRVSSVREVSNDARIDNDRYAPQPAPVYDSRRRSEERLFEANVTSVRAVMGTPEQRCWVEQEQVAPASSSANIPGAIAGAVIGGVLGHQVGGGRGKDLATAGGAVAGGVLGANIGRGETPAQTRDVQRCADVPASNRPEYWDVTYIFRGQEHHIQTTNRPGPTVTVNERGEPRVDSQY
ncbi:MAG TPA: beta/gamma crystallin-related protein [Azonexus sp.]|nr:beta/gamma crystallin-related protein [Azonexus sp.]